MSQPLEIKQPTLPPEQVGDLEVPTKATSQAARSEAARRERRRKNAEKLKKSKQEKSKNPRSEGEPKPRAEEIQEKYQEALVEKGEPLTAEEKLKIIEREMPSAKTARLQQQLDELQNELHEQQNPDSRKRIEAIVQSIPNDVYSDSDLAEIALEMKQVAYGHIMRNPAYMVAIPIEERLAMGQTFNSDRHASAYNVRSIRVWEDEEYLRSIDENIPHRELTQPELQEDQRVAHELVKWVRAKPETQQLQDVEAVLVTVRQSDLMDMDTAMRKINQGPDWIQKAAVHVKENARAATMLAELSDAYKLDNKSLDDGAYIYMKAAKLTSDTREIPFDDRNLSIDDAEADAVNNAINKAGKISTEVDLWLKKATIDIKGREQMTTTKGDEARWNNVNEPLRDDGREGELKKVLEGFNAYVTPLGGGFDEKIYETYGIITKNYYDLLGKIPKFYEKLWMRIEEVRKTNFERHQAFSTLYFEFIDQKEVYKNPELALRLEEDKYAACARLYPNKFQEAVARNQGNMIQFLTSNQFRGRMLDYYKNHDNWLEINKAGIGTITDEASLAKHPLYQVINDPVQFEKYFSRLVTKFTQADLLQNADVNFRGGDLSKMTGVNAAIAEHGQIVVRRDRGGINNRMYRALDRKAFTVARFDKQGDYAVVAGRALDRQEVSAREQFLTNREYYEPKLQGIYGKNVPYEQMVESSLKEMRSLLLIEGRRLDWADSGLSIHLAAGQKGNPLQFTSVGPEDRWKVARRPIERLFYRWSMVSPVMRHMIEKGTELDAERLGVRKYWETRVNQMDLHTPQGHKFLRWAFSIVEPEDSRGYKDIVGNNLQFFNIEENGVQNFACPTKLEQVSKSQLIRWLTFRTTLFNATDREATGAYGYREVGWNRDTKIRIFDQRFSKHPEVGLHERASKDVQDTFDPKSEDIQIEIAQERLIHKDLDPAHRDREGALVSTGRYSPVHNFDALASQEYFEALDFFDKHAAFYNEIFQQPQEIANPITASTDKLPGRRDLFMERFLMRQDMILEDIAESKILAEKQIYAIDFSTVDIAKENAGLDHDLYLTIKHVCDLTYTDPLKFLQAGKDLSDWALKPEQLEAIKNHAVASYFMIIHSDDPRYTILDSEEATYIQNKPFIDEPFSKEYSHQISEEDFSTGAGNVRALNDSINVGDRIVPDFMAMLEAGDEKTFIQHRNVFTTTEEMTGGYPARVKNMLIWNGAWYDMVQIDLSVELAGSTGEKPLVPQSDHQRIVGPGGLALPFNKVDEGWHGADIAVGGNIHRLYPHMTHVYERKLRLNFGTIGWPKFLRDWGDKIYLETGNKRFSQFFHQEFGLRTAWIPRFLAFGLLAGLLFGAGVVKSAKKGFSGQSGGGGGQEEHG